MRMGFLKITLLIHGSHSLKEKRRPLKSFIEKLKNRANASVAEVGSQDLHQRAEVGVAVVASDGGILARELQAIREYAYHHPDCQVLDIQEDSIGWRDE